MSDVCMGKNLMILFFFYLLTSFFQILSSLYLITQKKTVILQPDNYHKYDI